MVVLDFGRIMKVNVAEIHELDVGPKRGGFIVPQRVALFLHLHLFFDLDLV